MRTMCGAAATFLALASAVGQVQLKVAITAPINGSTVSERPIVEGTVSAPQAAVWIVVHPLETGDYWVQPRISVREIGSWKVQIYVEGPGSAGVGKLFDIRAVANPRAALREGLVLDRWPEAASMSDIVEVTRR